MALGVIEFLSSHILSPWIVVFLLSFLPLSESRGAIIYGLYAGLDPAKLLLVSTAANILAVPFIFWLIAKSRVMDLITRLLGKRIEQNISSNKKRFEFYEELILLIVVAAPIFGAGAWMGAIVADTLKLNRTRSIIFVSIGVVIATLLGFIGVEIFGTITGHIFHKA